MRNLVLALAMSGLTLLSSAAKADSFNFSAGALGASISGVLTATNNNNGTYSVTGISGNGITGLVTAGDPFFGNDNLLIPGNARALDINGLAFTGVFGGAAYSIDLYSQPSGYLLLALDSNGTPVFDTATFSLSAITATTPEPSSLLLLGTGLLGAGAAICRRLS